VRPSAPYAGRCRRDQPLTRARGEVTTKPPGGRARSASAPTREKRCFRGEVGRSREPLYGPGQPREAGVTRSRAAQQPGQRLRKCH
jgi:hypothetical protein